MKKQTKPQFQTPYNYVWTPHTVTTKDSVTVPGDAYSIPDLLARAQGGVPLNSLVKIHDEHFASDADFETFVPEDDFDIVDLQELHDNSSEVITDAKQKLATGKKSPPKGVKESPSEQKPPEGEEALPEGEAPENGPKNASP